VKEENSIYRFSNWLGLLHHGTIKVHHDMLSHRFPSWDDVVLILPQNYADLLQINLLALWDDTLHRGTMTSTFFLDFCSFLHNFTTPAS
jgi:hypothetical protein